MKSLRNEKFVKILKNLINQTKKLYLKMLLMINVIIIILMKKKLMKVTLKKLNNF